MQPSQTFAQQTAERAVVPEVVILAQLLHKLDRQPLQASAEQYRVVASTLAAELRRLPASPWLDALLRRYPEAAEVYENVRYDLAGLCRAPLEQAAAAEVQARQLLASVARRPGKTA
ncbi:MAG: hypothetical protein ACP5GC_05915 [Thiomonas sp.]